MVLNRVKTWNGLWNILVYPTGCYKQERKIFWKDKVWVFSDNRTAASGETQLHIQSVVPVSKRFVWYCQHYALPGLSIRERMGTTLTRIAKIHSRNTLFSRLCSYMHLPYLYTRLRLHRIGYRHKSHAVHMPHIPLWLALCTNANSNRLPPRPWTHLVFANPHHVHYQNFLNGYSYLSFPAACSVA